MYHEHAKEYAPKLGLRIAAKGKDGIAMAGFQLPQLDKYLKILVQDLDKHVAICDEFPEYINGELQTPIPRRVTRIITPGTLIDEEFVEQDKNNFLLSIQYAEPEGGADMSSPATAKEDSGKFGLAWIDISTGEFFVQTTDRAGLLSSLLRVSATEVVLSENINRSTKDQIASCLGLNSGRLTSKTIDSGHLDNMRWAQRLDQPLCEEEMSQVSSLENLACQQLFNYIDTHLLETKLRPKQPRRMEQTENMSLDRSSIRGLELLKTARDGFGKGSLINTIQRTVTKGGSRLLRERLIYPSIIPEVIEHRLDLVSAFLADPNLHQTILIQLRELFDIRRIAQKFALNRGDAEDLLCLAKSIMGIEAIVCLLKNSRKSTEVQQAFDRLILQVEIDSPKYLCRQIKNSIDEQGLIQFLKQVIGSPTETPDTSVDLDSIAPMQEGAVYDKEQQKEEIKSTVDRSPKEDPWIMQKAASPELNFLHTKLKTLDQQRFDLQESLRQQLAAPRLVLKYDTKFGHICQTPKSKSFNETAFQELGTVMVGNLKTIRSFYLTKWTKLGRELDNLKFEIRNEEQKIFQRLRQLAVENLVSLRQNASAMDELDVATSFATLALDEDWARPLITNRATHTIIGGRHPTVKLGLQEKGQSFVSNDLNLDRKVRAWLITGPNMAGKSTFLRQNALITILAQIGCYVPAEYAEVGIVDKIFSRIGAADDLFRNESTFMVEMLETASILRDATERSFVIMDEVGRGTAPEDGTAVAYASLHHLYHVNQCRTLFATHFHDIAEKTRGWPRLSQYCTDLHEDDSGGFTFIHKLRPGVNKNSHALKVAKMAGLPAAALEVANEMLAGVKDDASVPMRA